DVEFTRITAPVSGRVSRKLLTEGNLINGGIGTQGTLLTTIVSLDPLYVYFEASERDYLKYVRLAKLATGPSSRDFKKPVLVGTADEQGFPLEGYMDFVDNQIDRGTGTIQWRAIVPKPDGVLAPGDTRLLRRAPRLPGAARRPTTPCRAAAKSNRGPADAESEGQPKASQVQTPGWSGCHPVTGSARQAMAGS